MTVSLSFAATILLEQNLRLTYGDNSRHPASDWIPRGLDSDLVRALQQQREQYGL
jgi:hypothetical protein